MSYQVIIPKPVQKQLDDLPDEVFKRAIEKLDILTYMHFRIPLAQGQSPQGRVYS